jgi:hypothetical protein
LGRRKSGRRDSNGKKIYGKKIRKESPSFFVLDLFVVVLGFSKGSLHSHFVLEATITTKNLGQKMKEGLHSFFCPRFFCHRSAFLASRCWMEFNCIHFCRRCGPYEQRATKGRAGGGRVEGIHLAKNVGQKDKNGIAFIFLPYIFCHRLATFSKQMLPFAQQPLGA